MMTGEIKYNNVQSYSGTSAPWTGQIIVTEEEPAGKPNFNFNNLTLKFFFKSPRTCVCCVVLGFLFLTNRGRRSWPTSRVTGDGGNKELRGSELEAACRERP